MSGGRLSSSRYQPVSVVEDGERRTYRVALCKGEGCGHTARVRQGTIKPMPDDMISKKLVGWGWSLSPRLLCAKCRAEKRTLTPAQKRAAFCRIADVPRATPVPPVPANVPQPVEARAMPAVDPKTPTPADRRRIRDALDAHYDEDKGCYQQAHSDKSLAAVLTVPVAWVAELREANGLGPDKNEAAEKRSLALATAEKRLDDLETRWASDIDAMRAEIKRLKLDASYAGAA